MSCSSDNCDGTTYTGTFVRCPACAAGKAPKAEPCSVAGCDDVGPGRECSVCGTNTPKGITKRVVVWDRAISVPDGSLPPKTQSYGPHEKISRGLVAFAEWVGQPCR